MKTYSGRNMPSANHAFDECRHFIQCDFAAKNENKTKQISTITGMMITKLKTKRIYVMKIKKTTVI
jgi:hypothetical protein